MADFLDQLIQNSDRHAVKKITGGYQVMPRDSNHDAVIAFQSIADDVLEHEGLGYRVNIAHTASYMGIPDRDEVYDEINILVDEEK